MPEKKQQKNKAEDPQAAYNPASQAVNEFVSRLSPVLFWDTDRSKVDPETHAAYIVEKVVSFGTWEEWKLILSYYWKARVKEIVCNLRWLDAKTLNFLSFYFKIPLNKFRCYTEQQSNPTHFPY